MSLFKFITAPLASSHQKMQDSLLVNKMLLGKSLSNELKSKAPLKNLHEAEFKVFSQWGDDGIIQYIIQNTNIPHKTFIEFGVEDYTEANTRFLLMNDNWSGLIMDGSESNIARVKNDSIFWKYDLQCTAAFITSENINELIATAGFDAELGLLHIDIDGNDYWVWKAIHTVKPIVVIIEYNAIFGTDKPYTVPYDPAFRRTAYHYSNLLYGTSLLSICDLAAEKGYDFIGCNSAGNNAYFIRCDKNTAFTKLSPEQGFTEAKFKESRDRSGALSYIRYPNKRSAVSGQKIYNTRTQQIEIFQ